MRHLKIIILSNLFLFLLSCGTVKEGFSNQKKNNSDEFLVEKKTPLVMPPNYNELPEPKINQQEITEEKNIDLGNENMVSLKDILYNYASSKNFGIPFTLSLIHI